MVDSDRPLRSKSVKAGIPVSAEGTLQFVQLISN